LDDNKYLQTLQDNNKYLEHCVPTVEGRTNGYRIGLQGDKNSWAPWNLGRMRK